MAIEEFVMYGTCTLCISSSDKQDINRLIGVTNLRSGAYFDGKIEEDAGDLTDGKYKCYINVPNRGYYRINAYRPQQSAKVGGIVLYTTVGFGEFKEIPIDQDQFTWEGIQNMINSNRGEQLKALNGKTITLLINNGDDNIEIEYAVNYNAYNSGEVDFIPTHALPVTAITGSSTMCSPRGLFDTATNVGGYPQSPVCSMLNSEFYNLLPSEVKDHIKPKIVPATTGGKNGQAAITTATKIWLPTECEIFGSQKSPKGYNSNTTFATATGEAYPMFSDNKARIFYYQNASTTEKSIECFLATPVKDSAANFVTVKTNGAIYARSAKSAYGILPCFRFGKD